MCDNNSIDKKILEITDCGWKVQKRALSMTKRYDFASYDGMRDFLDDLQELSEKDDYYPDLTFSRSHVNVSIKSREDKVFTNIDFELAIQVDALAKNSSTLIEGGKNG